MRKGGVSITTAITRAAGPSAGFPAKTQRFRGRCDFQSRGAPRESPESDYSEGSNVVAYPFYAVLQAFTPQRHADCQWRGNDGPPRCCCLAIPSTLTAKRKCPHYGECDIDAARAGKTSGTQQLTGRVYDNRAGSDVDGSEHTPHQAHTGGLQRERSRRTSSR